MRRWIIATVCVALALASIASLGLWALSWRTAYCVSVKRDAPAARAAPRYAGFVSPAPGVDFFSMRGGLDMRVYTKPRGTAWQSAGATWGVTVSTVSSPKRITEMRQPRSVFNKAGFTAGSWNVSWAVGVPYWFLALGCAVPPVLLARAAIRRRRLAMAGHCRRCGYDLRASRGRCPECGEPIVSEAGASVDAVSGLGSPKLAHAG